MAGAKLAVDHPKARLAARRALRLVRPRTREQLLGYCRAVLGFDIPAAARLEDSSAPLDYLAHSFFERDRPRDCVVWANRGGGKTRLGAIATLLDLVFKPGVQIRILGGSLEQSDKMYAYLREMLEDDAFRDLVEGRGTERRVALANGSAVEILAQSERSVRGHRVQKVRCDEVEVFTPEVWQAVQFTTRSARCGDVEVRAAIEVFSTMHRPFGLMSRLVGDPSRRTFRWSVVDVLERCPAWRACEDCPLWDECGGRAKRGRGFLFIDDAIQQKDRASDGAWLAEMRCLRPSRSECVYPEFDEDVHVVPFEGPREAKSLTWLIGMDFGYRAPTVALWAALDSAGVLHVVDEHIVGGMTIDRHLEAIASRPWPRPAWLGIDPAAHQRHEHTGVSTATLLRRAGYAIRWRRLGLHAGLDAVRARLRPAWGEPRLFIDPRCAQLIRALREYHFPPDRQDDADPVKDGPDHAADALRYLVINLDAPSGATTIRPY